RIANKFEAKGRKFMSITIHAIMKSLLLFYLVIGFKIGIALLTLAEPVSLFFHTVVSILFIAAIARLVYSMVDVVDARMRDLAASSESTVSEMLTSLIGRSLKIIVIFIALLQVITLLIDKPLTSVLAGLGIGGLAFALAAQDTLKNFFGSLAIFSDKPFLIGERVVVDGHDGPVEDVGLRSTRIRTLEGHLVSVPNGELANKTIQNIGRRPYIRRLFNIGVTYDTPPEKIERALEIIKDILKDHEGMNPEFPPRVYFNEFNSDSLNILVIYWYHPPNYWDFLQFGERINFEILNRFNSEGIDFAFPTQTLHLAGDKKRPLNVDIIKNVPGSKS
ncbi:MAG: mechanosensitive ion channel family protein, partial [candidate division WOR-3 bacterium]